MNKKLNSISSKRKASRSSLIISTPAVSSNYSSNPMGGGINGFTIIEVALVLAIAGLIFLVVFIAWPALQNSQADTARRQDVGRVVSALESYKVDNQGTITAYSVQSSAQRIVHGGTGSFNDVNLGAYVVDKVSRPATDIHVWNTGNVGLKYYDTYPDHILIYLDYSCALAGSSQLAFTPGVDAVSERLSSGQIFCQNAS